MWLLVFSVPSGSAFFLSNVCSSSIQRDLLKFFVGESFLLYHRHDQVVQRGFERILL